MSARTSGVKNFVSIAKSLVRAFPLSQVKSANAKGSVFAGGAAPRSCLVERVADELEAATLAAVSVASPRVADAGPLLAATPAAEAVAAGPATSSARAGCTAAACAAGASAGVAAFGLPFASSSATRFSSCSTRSSSQRSRSVNPGCGASILLLAGFAAADLAESVFDGAGLSSAVPSSAANRVFGRAAKQRKTAQSTHKILFSRGSARIFLSPEQLWNLDKRQTTKDAS